MKPLVAATCTLRCKTSFWAAQHLTSKASKNRCFPNVKPHTDLHSLDTGLSDESWGALEPRNQTQSSKPQPLNPKTTPHTLNPKPQNRLTEEKGVLEQSVSVLRGEIKVSYSQTRSDQCAGLVCCPGSSPLHATIASTTSQPALYVGVFDEPACFLGRGGS